MQHNETSAFLRSFSLYKLSLFDVSYVLNYKKYCKKPLIDLKINVPKYVSIYFRGVGGYNNHEYYNFDRNC